LAKLAIKWFHSGSTPDHPITDWSAGRDGLTRRVVDDEPEIPKDQQPLREIAMKYERKDWRLVGNRVMWNEAFGVGFMMWGCSQGLTAIAVHYRMVETVFSAEEVALRPHAVKAYLSAIGMRRNSKKAVPN
jgi:hypothetical protein